MHITSLQPLWLAPFKLCHATSPCFQKASFEFIVVNYNRTIFLLQTHNIQNSFRRRKENPGTCRGIQKRRTGIWGKYFDETRRDEQVFGGRVLRTGVSGKSQVAGEQEQEYSARPRICHSRGWSPVRGIRPSLLGVEARRPSQQQLARRAFLSENQGTKSTSIRPQWQ